MITAWLWLWLTTSGCALHECRTDLIVDTETPRDSSPCGNADSTELVDTDDEYYYSCEWFCVQYSGECQRVWITLGYVDGWVQNPEVVTETCKTTE